MIITRDTPNRPNGSAKLSTQADPLLARTVMNSRPDLEYMMRLTPWNSIADLVKALLDRSKTRFNPGFEFMIGEDIRLIVFDAFPHKFTNVSRIDACTGRR